MKLWKVYLDMRTRLRIGVMLWGGSMVLYL